MDEFRGNHIPAFGSWDSGNQLPFTQCFESARQGGFVGYSYGHSHGHGHGYPQDRDLYVAGDLYENNVVTPAMIVVPRRRLVAKVPARRSKKESRVVSDYDYDYDYDYDFVYGGNKHSPSEHHLKKANNLKVNVKSKAVDEDLYQVSPELLRAPPRRKSKRWGLFSMCMQPASSCVM